VQHEVTQLGQLAQRRRLLGQRYTSDGHLLQ
jgi:hypothetical protein